MRYLNHFPGMPQDIFGSDEPIYAIVDEEDFFREVMFNESTCSVRSTDIGDAVCDGYWLKQFEDYAKDDVRVTAELIYDAWREWR